MVLNKSKCGVLVYNESRKKLAKWESTMNEEEDGVSGIPIVSHYKYLGIEIDKRMGFSFYLERLTEKINKYVKLASILNNFQTPFKVKVELLKSLGLSLIYYSAFIFHEEFSTSDERNKF